MLAYIISFLILLNPFALFVYLLPLKKELGLRPLATILLRASVISFVIYTLFAIFGTGLFKALLIDFESFRIFGGVVLVGFALSFILMGKRSMIATKGEFNQIAAEVALPFIVGAGTITQSILIGYVFTSLKSAVTIFLVMVANFIIIMAIAFVRHSLKPRLRVVFDRNAEIVLRMTGFLVGAYGVDLIVTGIRNIISS